MTPRAAATRRAILDAARSCFAERGLAAAATREIARRAGITQPLIHHYFGSKEELFDAVLEDAVETYEQTQSEQWARPMDDIGFFAVGLAVLFRWLGDNHELMRLAAWARLEGRTQLNEGTVTIYERVRARLRAANERGLLRDGVDVDIAMLLIEALFKGYWDRRAQFEQYPLDSAELDARVAEQSIVTLLRGLLTPAAAELALAQLRTSSR